MPNGYDYRKEYGPHDYGDDPHRTVNCKHRCGCAMGPSTSDGPIGVDPFGECPGNPKDGKLLGGNADQRVVVTRRIRALERRAMEAEARAEELEEIDKSKKAELFRENKQLEGQLKEIQRLYNELHQALEKLKELSAH